VLVHGLGSRWQVFEPILDRLAAHHEVIAVDLPGFGARSMDDAVEHSVKGYADWLERWLHAHDIDRPHVVGNSMGGGIALELAASGAASRVTVFSPAGFWNPIEAHWTTMLITTMRVSARTATPAISALLDSSVGRRIVLGALFGRPAAVAPEAARGDIQALRGAAAFSTARDNLARYRFSPPDPAALPPITIAWGTRDVVIPHRVQSARARTMLPLARHVDLPGCGHIPFSDDPAACADVVLAPLERP